MQKRLIVIGDIHGCYLELMRLLDRIGPGKDDEITSTGDLIDGGPNSPAVVEYFIQHNLRPVSGNHEHDHVWQASLPEGKRALTPTKARTVEQFRAAYRDRSVQITYEDAITYFAGLSRYKNLKNALIVHAGVDYETSLDSAKHKHVLLGLGSQNKNKGDNGKHHGGLPLWSETYPSNVKPVIFGHRAISDCITNPWKLPQRENLWPLDTKCVRGGFLTAVTLPDFKVYQVRSETR